MKASISISLSKDLLATIDELAVNHKSRSAFIEFILRKAITQKIRAERDARDIEIINQNLDYLNAEAEDVLSYQIIPW